MTIDPNNLAGTAQLSFVDDFNGAAGALPNLWNAATNTGTWDTVFPGGPTSTPSKSGDQLGGESEWYINDNYSGTPSGITPWTLDGSGHLTIKATAAANLTSAQQTWLHNANPNATYASGMINSAHAYVQTYGYFEMDATLTDTAGAWPAFWLLGASASGSYVPPVPEIDVMEILANNRGQTWGQTLTASDLTVAIHDGNDGIGNGYGAVKPISDSGTNEHRFGVDVEANEITWYVDGNYVYSIATPSAFVGLPLYMIANLAMGGAGGTTTGADSSITINSIKAYQPIGQNNGVVYTGGNYNAATDSPAGAGITTILLQGTTSQTVTGNDLGDVIGYVGIPEDPGTGPGGDSGHAPSGISSSETMIGGAGADKIYIGTMGDTATGKGGADTFVLARSTYNWANNNAPAHITDFGNGADVIDTSVMYANVQGNGHSLALEPVSGNPSEMQLWETDGNGANVVLQLVIDMAPGASNAQLASNHDSITVTPAPSGPSAGNTIVSDNNGDTQTGTSGNDLFLLGRGGDHATGLGGADIFNFKENPWAAGHITDFTGGDDVVELSGMLARVGYTGSNAIGDGVLEIVSDSSGAQIWSDPGGPGSGQGRWLMATLDGVSASSIELAGQTVVGVHGGSYSATGDYTAAAGDQVITLNGTSSQTIYGNNAGDVFISNNNSGDHMIGGTGNDVFNVGRGGDTLTGGGGSDIFVFNEAPWATTTITDYQPGVDHVDLQGMLQRYGYTGTDPFTNQGQGTWLEWQTAANGDAQVWVNLGVPYPGSGWYMVADFAGVSQSSLHQADGWII